MSKQSSCGICHMTRRHFLKTAAAAGALAAFARHSFAGTPHAASRDVSLFAACGLYCGACESLHRSMEAKQSSAIQCLGCWSNEKPPAYGEKCQVRSCCKKRKIKTCGECDDFPCPTIQTFFTGGPRYELREKYLWQINKDGLAAWLADQKKRWTCTACGSSFAYGDKRCPECGKPVLTAEEELADFNKTKSSIIRHGGR